MADASPPDPAPASRDGPIALGLVALVVGTVLLGALAPPAAHPPPAKAASLPETDPACAEWSDGCHVCRRLPDGPACSLPGIACTPGPDTCTRRTAP